jgi:YbbR domain-containing protein
MIEHLRTFLQTNLMFKIAALLLAILIWTMVNRAINSGAGAGLPEESRTLPKVSVLVLGRATAQGEAVLKPDVVSVTIRGHPNEVHRFNPATQLTLYVDISNLSGPGRYRQQIQSSIRAAGVQVDQISPNVVEIELR